MHIYIYIYAVSDTQEEGDGTVGGEPSRRCDAIGGVGSAGSGGGSGGGDVSGGSSGVGARRSGRGGKAGASPAALPAAAAVPAAAALPAAAQRGQTGLAEMRERDDRGAVEQGGGEGEGDRISQKAVKSRKGLR